MTIKSLAVLDDGMTEGAASEFWNDVEGFAAYSFNKSHSCAYSLISYQSMFLKTHYPAEFWAGLLSMVKDDRNDAALTDMTRMGLKLLPPDVNYSELRFAPVNSTTIAMPFAAIKGINDRGGAAILAARKAGGPFVSMLDFEERVPGNKVHSGQREALDKVGAFSRIEPGQPAADDPCRRRDQTLLLPGLIAESVIIDRPMEINTTSILNLQELIESYKACDRCGLTGLCHPKPYIHGPTKAMIVLDAPSVFDEREDEMGAGGPGETLRASIKAAGLAMDDLYITALVKSPKAKGKNHSTKTLAECSIWLAEEIRILRPPVIVILGSNAYKYFFPGAKGGIGEAFGKVSFDVGRDANLLVGLNPATIYFNPDKQADLNEVMIKLVELLPV